MHYELLRLLVEPLQENRVAVSFALLLMAMDIIMGVTNAAVHHELKSSVMRTGLTKKIGSIYAMMAASVVDSMLIGGIRLELVSTPILLATCIYLMVMEVLSIVENIKKLNPDLAELPFIKAIAERLAK